MRLSNWSWVRLGSKGAKRALGGGRRGGGVVAKSTSFRAPAQLKVVASYFLNCDISTSLDAIPECPRTGTNMAFISDFSADLKVLYGPCLYGFTKRKLKAEQFYVSLTSHE